MSSNRIANDHSFDCSDLIGLNVEFLIGFYDGKIENGMDIVILKLKEKELCQRYFLDARIGFWEQMTKAEAVFDFADLNEIDLTEKYKLDGKTVSTIECIGSIDEASFIMFELEDVKLKFQYFDLSDFDSEETVLQYIPQV